MNIELAVFTIVSISLATFFIFLGSRCFPYHPGYEELFDMYIREKKNRFKHESAFDATFEELKYLRSSQEPREQ